MTATLSATDFLLGDRCYTELKDYVLRATGLNYYQDKDACLANRVGRRLAALGIRDCALYLEILRDPRRGAAELDELVAEITIGETYFFRHSEHFQALRDIVLPDVIARNQASRSIRVWCAGCADGQEPYSLAILMKRELAHGLAGWAVSILGTDINRRCLARARQGRFEEWAFRTTPEEVKRECFTKEGNQWVIAQEYRDAVSFQPDNLAEHHFPSPIHGLASFDLIICRNVMIYFTPEMTGRVVGQFHDCLAPGGWLLVGPTEPNMSSFGAFRVVNALGVTLYQRPLETARRVTEERAGITATLPLPPPIEASARTVRRHPAPDLAPVIHDAARRFPVTAAPPPTLAEVRAHGDRGDWAEALRRCRELLKSEALNSLAYLYYALILEQTSGHDETEQALRRAIYLDRQAVLPPYYMGVFLQAHGDPRLAVKSFENALDLLALRNDAESFPEADQITVADLKALSRMHIGAIGRGNRGHA